MARNHFLGCPVDNLTMDEAVEEVVQFVETRTPHRVTAINANKLWQMAHNAELHRLVIQSELIIPEYAVVWGAAQLGTPLRGHIGGIMLLQSILPVMASKGIRPFFLGAKRQVIERLMVRLREDYPMMDIAGYGDGYFKGAETELLEEIRHSRPDILFVALGTPTQEYWIAANQEKLGVPVAMGVGGSFDVLSGIKKDTPNWARSKGLEWLYRLAQEPSAYWKRYLITNTWFVMQVLKAKTSLQTG